MTDLNLDRAFRSISDGELKDEDRAYLTRIMLTFFENVPADTRVCDLLEALRSGMLRGEVVSWEEGPFKRV